MMSRLTLVAVIALAGCDQVSPIAKHATPPSQYINASISRLIASTNTWPSNGTPTDIQSIHNMLAQDGDTITLPAGTFPWTSGVSITKQITLQGAGTSATGGGDQTVIVDNISANQAVVNFNNSANTLTVRMTGITVRSGTGTIKDSGTCVWSGPMKLRIDHCHFVASSVSNYRIVYLNAAVFGVMDHCIVDLTGNNSIYPANGRRENAQDIMGNYEWSLPTGLGSSDYFFIEDNIINGNVNGGTYSSRCWDGFTAARIVERFNNVSQATLGETHAVGHSGDDRGTRSQEVYGNSVTSSLQFAPNFCALDMGSGNTLLWGNSWNNVYKSLYHFNVTRKNNDTYNQTAQPNGWGYAGTEFNGTGSTWDGGTALGTDTLKGYPCLDQPGRGQGDLIRGLFPGKVNTTTGTQVWPHQALEPIYIWNNVGSVVPGWGGNAFDNNTGGRVVANRDYYPPASGIQTSPTSPFNGTSGTGWGTIANRPTTCTPGVAYFATDQGSWNTSTSNPYGVQQNGADGVLYKCTSINTWTLYYTPYTYPHPLQGGGSPTPMPTSTVQPSPTVTATPSASPTATQSSTPAPSPTVTAAATPTASPTATFTPTPTVTATATATATASPTSTPGGGWTQKACDNFSGHVNGSNLTTSGLWTANNGAFSYDTTRSAGSNSSESLGNTYSYTGTSFISDQYAQATLIFVNAGPREIGVAVRAQGTPGNDSAYGLDYTQGLLRLDRRVNGVWTNIDWRSKSYVGGEKLRLEVVGSGSSTRLTAYEDTGSGFVAVFTNIDPIQYLSGGSPGLWGYSNYTGFEIGSWCSGDKTGGTPTPSPTSTPVATATATAISTATATPSATATGIALQGVKFQRGNRWYIRLTWTGANGARVNVMRDGIRYTNRINNGVVELRPGNGTHAWKICETVGGRCSNEVTITIP